MILEIKPIDIDLEKIKTYEEIFSLTQIFFDCQKQDWVTKIVILNNN